jgi:hypothetical protein
MKQGRKMRVSPLFGRSLIRLALLAIAASSSGVAGLKRGSLSPGR